MSPVARLMVLLGSTNLAFWLMWPASVVRVEARGWGELQTGLFGSAAWSAAILTLVAVPTLTRRFGFKATAAASCVLLLLSGAGLALSSGGPLERLWTALVGAGLGLRWGTVDAWLADTAEPSRRGRVLSIGETIAGGTAALGPAAAAALVSAASVSTLGLVATGLASVGLLSCLAAREPGSIEPSAGKRRGPSGSEQGSP